MGDRKAIVSYSLHFLADSHIAVRDAADGKTCVIYSGDESLVWLSPEAEDALRTQLNIRQGRRAEARLHSDNVVPLNPPVPAAMPAEVLRFLDSGATVPTINGGDQPTTPGDAA